VEKSHGNLNPLGNKLRFCHRTVKIGQISAQQNGVQQLALNAQIQAVPFYTRFGFVPVGSEFVEAGIMHLAMICDLRR